MVTETSACCLKNKDMPAVEAAGYDSSRSKRITYHRSIWGYSNILLSEELCFHCLLVFSVKKQQDLSLSSCVHRRDESKALSSDKLGK